MVSKTPSRRPPRSLKSAISQHSDSEFLLVDYRVIKLLAERHLPSEVAKKGTFQVSTSIGDLALPQDGDQPFGFVDYNVALNGVAALAEGSEKGALPEKSFSVSMELEGRFRLVDCPEPLPEPELERLVRPIIQQLHAIAVDKLRQAVSELGYHGVRPELGRRIKDLAIEPIPD